MRAFLLFPLLASLAVASCAGESRNNSDDDDASSVNAGAGGGTGGGMQDPDAPQFVSFTANVDTLYDGHSVTFTAVMSDPQGVVDVSGGVLRGAEGGDYGTFTRDAELGSFSITLTWSDINALVPIDFAYGSAEARQFVAEFFDLSDHRSTTQLSLDLTCANGWAGCAGSCTDTMNDDANCGSCGGGCNDDLCSFGNYCISGSCGGGEEIDCSDWDDVCVVGTCNPQNGSCSGTPVANNTACNDLDSCTSGDVCNGGSCGGTPITSCIHSDGCCPTVCTSSNDNDCGVGCNATSLGSLSPQSTSGSTTTATNSYSGSCGGSTAPERIYAFTAPATGVYTIDTVGSSFDTILYVRTSSCTGTELDCDDDGGGGTQSLVSVSLSSAQTVYIFVDGYSTYSGSFALNISGP